MKRTAMAFMIAGVLVGSSACGGQAEHASKSAPPSISLHEAALVGNVAAVRQHIRAGTDLDARDAYGSTPLVVAATFGSVEAAEALLEGGADINRTNNDGSTPLHIAAFLCYTEVVDVLLKGGADKSIRNKAGRTARDLVEGPFESRKAVYDGLQESLGPLGLRLDYEQIRATRPKIAAILAEPD